jgi:hypothetical protein
MRLILVAATGILGGALAGCGGSPTPVPSPTPTPGLSRLSGNWTGTVTTTPLGTCGPAAGSTPITLNWQVTDAGDTVIDQGGTTNWNGRISTDLTGNLNKISVAICGTTPRSYTAVYAARIVFDGTRYQVDMQADELWCPPDCSHRLRYVISK